MCGCIVEQFGEGQGIFVGDFFLCGGEVTEGDKHCVVDCTAVMK